MVRLLLNASDAAYDSGTKKYTFTLDRRIDRPTSIKVVKAVFKAATQSGSAYPLVLYVRSDALHAVIRDKHTLRVKSSNHEQICMRTIALGATRAMIARNAWLRIRTKF